MRHFLLTILILLFIAANAFAKTYKVTASKLNVRNIPDKSGSVVGSVSQDTEVEVITISDGWAEIKYKGKTAYISAQYITPVKRSSSGTQSTSDSQSKQGAYSSSGSSDKSSKSNKSDNSGRKTTLIDNPRVGGFHVSIDAAFTGRSQWNRVSNIDPVTGEDMGLWDYTQLGIKGNNVYGLSVGIGFEYNHVVYRAPKANLMVGFRTGLHYDWCGSLAKNESTPSDEGWLPGDYHRSRLSVHSLTIPLQPVLSVEIPVGRSSIGVGVFSGPIFETFLGINNIDLVFSSSQFSMLISNNVTGKVSYLFGGNGVSSEIPEEYRSGVFNCMWGTGAFVQFSRFRLTVSTDWGISNYSVQKGDPDWNIPHIDGRWQRFINAGFQIVLL